MTETEQVQNDEDDIEELPEDHVEDPEEFFGSNEKKETQFEHRGQTIKLKYKEITRGTKYEAMEKAALAYMEENPEAEEVRPLPSVLENELVKRVITWWNLPKHPSIGWDLLKDDDLADKILEEVGVKDAIQQPTEDHPEVQNAKNSS